MVRVAATILQARYARDGTDLGLLAQVNGKFLRSGSQTRRRFLYPLVSSPIESAHDCAVTPSIALDVSPVLTCSTHTSSRRRASVKRAASSRRSVTVHLTVMSR